MYIEEVSQIRTTRAISATLLSRLLMRKPFMALGENRSVYVFITHFSVGKRGNTLGAGPNGVCTQLFRANFTRNS